jgi:hypothetical protein
LFKNHFADWKSESVLNFDISTFDKFNSSSFSETSKNNQALENSGFQGFLF